MAGHSHTWGPALRPHICWCQSGVPWLSIPVLYTCAPSQGEEREEEEGWD